MPTITLSPEALLNTIELPVLPNSLIVEGVERASPSDAFSLAMPTITVPGTSSATTSENVSGSSSTPVLETTPTLQENAISHAVLSLPIESATPLEPFYVNPTSLNFGSLSYQAALPTFTDTLTSLIESYTSIIVIVPETATASEPFLVSPGTLDFGSLAYQSAIPTFIDSDPLLNESFTSTSLRSFVDALAISEQVSPLVSNRTFIDSASPGDSYVALTTIFTFTDSISGMGETVFSREIQTFTEYGLPSEQITLAPFVITLSEAALHPNEFVQTSGLQSLFDTGLILTENVTGVGQFTFSPERLSPFEQVALTPTSILLIESALSPSDIFTVSLTQVVIDGITLLIDSMPSSSALLSITDIDMALADQTNLLIAPLTIVEPSLSPDDSGTLSTFLITFVEFGLSLSELYTTGGIQSFTDTTPLTESAFSTSITLFEPPLNAYDLLYSFELFSIVDATNLSDMAIQSGVLFPLPEGTGTPVEFMNAHSSLTVFDILSITEQSVSLVDTFIDIETLLPTEDVFPQETQTFFDEIDLLDDSALLPTPILPTITLSDMIPQASDDVMATGLFNLLDSIVDTDESITLIMGLILDADVTPTDDCLASGLTPLFDVALTPFDTLTFIPNYTNVTYFALACFLFRGGRAFGKPLFGSSASDISPWYVNQTDPEMLAVLRNDTGHPINLEYATNFTLLIHSTQGVDRLGTGAFTVLDGKRGLLVYSWGAYDAAQAGNYTLQLIVQDTYGTNKSDPIAWNVLLI